MTEPVRRLSTSCILIGLFSLGLFAQGYSAQPEDSKVWVDGTSNNGDWTVFATEFDVDMTMSPEVSAENPGLEKVDVVIPAKKVLSNKSVIMDRLVHNAFKSAEHPDISYSLSSTAVEPGAGGTFTMTTKGVLTLAGVSREIEMPVEGEILGDGSVRFKGSHAFPMSAYEIEPPTALFGRFRVIDDVTVYFDLLMKPAAS